MLCCPFSKLAMHFTFIVTKQFKNNNRAYHLNTRKTTVAIQYKYPALPISRPSLNFLEVSCLVPRKALWIGHLNNNMSLKLGRADLQMDWPG